MAPVTISYEIVRRVLDAQSGYPRRADFLLGEHDNAWNSSSTKRSICGPARVAYIEYADGGIDTVISE